MERVDGMLRKLKLSEAEMAGLRINEQQMELADGGGKEAMEPKVLVKVMSEKLASTEGLKQALGPIWCPIRGIKCTKRGENIFMITLLQFSGKKKALDCGPWMFNNDLVVVEEYDPGKSVEDYKFDVVPIWIRVLKLPLGKMNKATGEMIGERVGEWLEADVGEDDLAAGEYLRIKVRIDITKPLMRGMMIQVGEEGRNKWCPFEYEFLPEFCYNCGVIGHDENSCPVPTKKGEEKQFGSWLRAYIPRKQNSTERKKWSNGGGSGSGGRSFGFGERRGTDGSNSLSWRKGDSDKVSSATEDLDKAEKEQEITSPFKGKGEKPDKINPSEAKKKLDWATMVERQEQEEMQMTKGKATGVSWTGREEDTQIKPGQVVGEVHIEGKTKDKGTGKQLDGNKWKNSEKGNTFKRRNRSKVGSNTKMGVKIGTKRGTEQMDVDVEEEHAVKKGKVEESTNLSIEAGLSEQPCKAQ